MIDREDIDQHVRLRILEGTRQKREHIVKDMYKLRAWNDKHVVFSDHVVEKATSYSPLSEMIVREFVNSLTSAQRKVLELRLMGYSQSEIARMNNRGKSSISHIIKHIRKTYYERLDTA